MNDKNKRNIELLWWRNVNEKKIFSNNQLYLELSLAINKQMYDDNEISYNIFKITEDLLLKKIRFIEQKDK